MRLSRRDVLRSLAGASAFAALPGITRAQQSDFEANTVAALTALDTYEPILSYDTAYNLQLAVRSYQQLVASGGWQAVPAETYGLSLGWMKEGVVSQLKRRLIVSGDLAASAAPQGRGIDTFDVPLDLALRRFQARHGLVITGWVDEPTYYALNISANYRLAQLQLNALRIERMAPTLAQRYVVVNIPAAVIEAIDGASVYQRHTAVVGRIDRQTPILRSRITQINFNPYWNVPKSIIERDLIPLMRQDPTYLTRFNIKIYDGRGREIAPATIDWTTMQAANYLLRQEPGSMNSMGHVKINFVNPHNVYLHDTPSKDLFDESVRFHSSGCVRVDEVNLLVAWLLRDTPEWDIGKIDAAFANTTRQDVSVRNPVPIHTTYITAWANRQGTVSFRDDVYQFDAVGKVEFA